MYNRANYDEIINGLEVALDEYIVKSPDEDVGTLWTIFKSLLSALAEKYIPSKYAQDKRKVDKPWVSGDVKKLIKKRSRLCEKYKRNPTVVQPRLEELDARCKRAIAMAKTSLD